jgi:Cysteine dioxygenase type I
MVIELRDRPDVADGPLPPRLLAAIAAGWAAAAEPSTLPEPGEGARAYRRVLVGERYDVWIIRWGPRSSAPLHDHAGSAGALHVVDGVLTEEDGTAEAEPGRWRIVGDRSRVFGVDHVHEVRNDADSAATSVHVYSPPLEAMTYYLRTTGPVPLAVYRATVDEIIP